MEFQKISRTCPSRIDAKALALAAAAHGREALQALDGVRRLMKSPDILAAAVQEEAAGV